MTLNSQSPKQWLTTINYQILNSKPLPSLSRRALSSPHVLQTKKCPLGLQWFNITRNKVRAWVCLHCKHQQKSGQYLLCVHVSETTSSCLMGTPIKRDFSYSPLCSLVLWSGQWHRLHLNLTEEVT